MNFSKKRSGFGVIIMCWIICPILLVTLVPKNRMREACVAFFFKQVITWLFGLIVVEKNLIRYPVRLFKKANRTSFTFEYLVFPTVCVFFNLYFPNGKSLPRRAFHYTLYTSILTILEVFSLHFTKLIVYIKWTWYYSFITMWLSFYFSRLFQKWFVKGLSESNGESF